MSSPEVWRRGAGGEHQTQMFKAKVRTVIFPNPGPEEIYMIRNCYYWHRPLLDKITREIIGHDSELTQVPEDYRRFIESLKFAPETSE